MEKINKISRQISGYLISGSIQTSEVEKMLDDRGLAYLKPLMMGRIKKVLMEKTYKGRVLVETAGDVSQKIIDKAVGNVSDEGAKDLQKKIRKDLVGGVRVTTEGIRLDLTIDNQLKGLERALKN